MKLPKPMTVAELAALVGGRARGDEAAVITGLAALAEAGPGDVSFLENPKYAAAAADSGAGCLLLPPAAADAPAKAPARVLVPEPRAAFASLARLVEEERRKAGAAGVSPRAFVHPGAVLEEGVSVGDFAVIEEGARLGAGTIVMAQCFVGRGARLGRRCLLHPRAVVREDCVLGEEVVIHSGAVIGDDGFGFTTDRATGRHTKVPQIGNVVVGDRAEIGANSTVDRAAVGSTVIGAGTQIDNLVQVAHNVRVGENCVLVAQCGVAGSTTIGRSVVLAGQVGVAGHLRVGDGAVIAAQSGVMSDVPARAALFGSPARPHREAFRLLAYYGRLIEIAEDVKAVKEKLGLAGSARREDA